MKRIIPAISFFLVQHGALALQASIFTQPLPDTDKFRCKYCPEPESMQKSLTAGIGFNTASVAKANEYNGTNGNHVIPQLNGNIYGQWENDYVRFQTQHLGDASREMLLEAGRYGDYRLDLDYDQISRFQFDHMQTAFVGEGSDKLKLSSSPPQETGIQQQRYRFRARLSKTINRRWQSLVNYQVENKTGLQLQGAAVYPSYTIAESAMLPVPIDQTTHLLNLGLSFYSSIWQMQAGYRGSIFKNKFQALTWQNPFSLTGSSSNAVDTAQGRLALAPDNQTHQLYVLLNLRPWQGSSLKAQVMVGKMLQDQDFLAYTVNSSLPGKPLPRSSLGGDVDTLAANVRGSLFVSDRLDVLLGVGMDRKDNNTPTASYQYVTLDTLDSGSKTRRNVPYGYRKYNANAAGRYRFSKDHVLKAKYEYVQVSQPHTEVRRTRAHRFSLKEQHPVTANLRGSITYRHEQRHVGDYQTLTGVQPAQNPLMRKYYLADRERNQLGLAGQYNGMETIDLAFYLDYAKDDFSQSRLGLRYGWQLDYGLEMSSILSESLTLHAFWSQEQLGSKQSGMANAKWEVTTHDSFTSLGLGIDWETAYEELDMMLDYHWAISRGTIETQAAVDNGELPELTSNRHTLALGGRYRYDELISLHVAYYFEFYDASDWHVDGQSYNSVNSVLGLGQKVYSYNAHFVTASLVYRF